MSERGEFKTTYGTPMPSHATAGPAHDAAVERLGYPGDPPFTRGVQPTMYRGRLWTMRQ
ncbi:MAG TPA: methylmalonyl-CoA mutase, partial [Chloroflexi bacterium]|nr:methylmalonyl-CoA mutase [Chloroflexota bacterium]